MDTSAAEAVDTSAGVAADTSAEVADTSAGVVSTLVVAVSTLVVAECISAVDACVSAVAGCVSAAYRIWAACIWVEAISEACAAAAATRAWAGFRRADYREARAVGCGPALQAASCRLAAHSRTCTACRVDAEWSRHA